MLRKASAKDVEQICRIYNYYIQNSISNFEESLVSQTEMALRVKKISARFPYLVSEESGRVQGFAYASDWKQRAAYKFTVETSVYIDHEETEHNSVSNDW